MFGLTCTHPKKQFISVDSDGVSVFLYALSFCLFLFTFQRPIWISPFYICWNLSSSCSNLLHSHGYLPFPLSGLSVDAAEDLSMVEEIQLKPYKIILYTEIKPMVNAFLLAHCQRPSTYSMLYPLPHYPSLSVSKTNGVKDHYSF